MGVLYPALYVRVNRDFGINDSKAWGDAAQSFTYLVIDTPTSEYPDNPYSIGLYVDFFSQDYTSPLTAGTVIKCEGPEPMDLYNPFTVDFYDD